MDSSGSSCSSQPYDVFLSFRGEDTRNNFMSHLYAALVRNQIETYMDEITLERGDELSRAISEAIQKSKISIIIFSENYASSSWCLRELVQILKCRRQNNQIVLPIFHKVDPSDIRKQKGSYGEAFAKHEERLEDQMDVVHKWRNALTESAQFSGWAWNSHDTRSEAELIKDIVKDVSTKLGRMRYSSYVNREGLIGIEHRLQNIDQWLLSTGSPDVRIICIWGLGGIGKTTLASVVFAEHYYQFETCYFLENVREESERHGLTNLRNKLLNGLLKGSEDINLGNPSLLPHVKSKLSHKKVLVVLDDVNDFEQLDELLLGGSDSFAPGSRIIVTTRDADVFRGADVFMGFEIFFNKVGELNYDEALQLFQWKAFGRNSPPTDYIELTNEVVKYAGGIPLAIKTLASHLRSRHSRSTGHWEKTLNYLKGKSHDKIHKCLRLSYDVGLDEEEKAIFLDIACFFKGESREMVENILDGCGFTASAGIGVLIDKGLVTIRSDCGLWMHDLIQEMGWKIIQQQSEKQLGKYSRLWIAKDVFRVLNNNEGTDKVEGIFLNMSQLDEELHLKPEVFQKMNNLRLLKIYTTLGFGVDVKVHINQDLQSLPNSLRYLHWEGYPSKQLPSNFQPQNLFELNLPHSQLEQLFNRVQNIENLKGIDLSNSIRLIQFPDFSNAPNLEKINLEYCKSLPEVHSHCLRNLNKLIDLNLSHCNAIEGFSDGVDLTSLRNLSVRGCSNLKTFPAVINLRCLVSLNLSRTAIENLPSSIGSLSNLSSLCLSYCKRLVEVPSSISKLDSLKDLVLSGCSILKEFPVLPQNIEILNMDGTAIKEVASSSIECRFVLKKIRLEDCTSLESLPTSIFKLRSLAVLVLNGCSSLTKLPDISEPMNSLQVLELGRTGIRQLPSSIKHLIGLQFLYLDGCENLVSVSNSISNLNALCMLELSSCKKLECMPSSFGPLYLKIIYLSDCDIREIPEAIKGLKLKWLHIDNCKNLRFLPELPLTLKLIGAFRCVSLEMVSSTEKAFTQKFWDDYTTDTYDGDGCWGCLFYDCFKLDQNGRQTTNTEFQLRVLSLAARPKRPGYTIGRSSVNTCYPGNEIPNWFYNQVEGSSITIKLPQQWRDTKFLGFVVCAVGDSHIARAKVAGLRCKLNFVLLNGKNHKFSSSFTRANCPLVQPLEPAVNSDHVYMWYQPPDDNYHLDAVEVTFQFAFNEFIVSREDVDIMNPSMCEVKRCGIRTLYQKDVDEFFSNNEYLLEPPAKKMKKSENITGAISA